MQVIDDECCCHTPLQDVVCVMVAHDFKSGEFVCQLPFFPPIQDADVSADSVHGLILVNVLLSNALSPWIILHRERKLSRPICVPNPPTHLCPPQDFTPDRCLELLSSAIGRPVGTDLRIHSVRPWTMHSQVADR
jgi:hypothetical protein